MNKILFKITENISIKLNDIALNLVEDGKKYNQHKVLFHILDDLSGNIYNFGYNNFVLGR